jgi:hypothetical protein
MVLKITQILESKTFVLDWYDQKNIFILGLLNFYCDLCWFNCGHPKVCSHLVVMMLVKIC